MLIQAILLILVVESKISLELKSKPRAPTPVYFSSNRLDTEYKSEAVTNYYNLQYYIDISVGTPGQVLTAVIDTGSSWLWIPSTVCECHESEHRYNESESASYENSNIYTSIYYGVGSVSGNISKETVSVSGLQATGQYFILASKDSSLDELSSDGLLGLAFSLLSSGHSTYIDNLKGQGQIEARVFSIYLSNYFNPALQSTLTIGGYEKDYIHSDKLELNIIPDYGFWLTTSSSMTINSSNGTVYIQHETYVILDIGTSFLLGPQEEISSIVKAINSTNKCEYLDQLLVCECNYTDLSSFPSIQFSMENNNYFVRPQSYIFVESGMCIVCIDYSGSWYWIFGQVFFREYYSVYDMDNYKVYLYQVQEHVTESSTSFGYAAVVVLACLAFYKVYNLRVRNNKLYTKLLA